MQRLIFALILLSSLGFAQQATSAPNIFVVNSAPAAGSLATASIAADDGHRHVLFKACFSAGATTAPVLTQLAVNLRDGATTAGTVKASFVVIIPAATGQSVAPFCTGDLHIKGTVGTAMTAEWSSSLANLFEQVTLYYYDIPAK